MSNGRFKATVHRVVDIGEERYSVPFFYEPSVEANINAKIPRPLLPPESLTDEEPEYYPYAAFLFRKRTLGKVLLGIGEFVWFLASWP